MKMKILGPLALVALFAAAVLGWQPLKAIYFSGVPDQLQDTILLIPTGATFPQVVDSLKAGGFISDQESFRWLAGKMKYIRPEMRAGRYEIEPGWTNRQLIQHLRAGKQAPVNVVLNNERLTEEIAGRLAQFLEPDSLQFLRVFSDPGMLARLGYSPETFISLFIPNTYQMFWNTSPDGFLERMAKEHEAFWSKNDRQAKAKALGLSREQVYTLASIVERETNVNSEKPAIAGVYLNRLDIHMPLQADPTAVFATRDFTTRRVTEFHTTFNSPYNTYVNKGLPPGPISMASIASIDAVLNRQNHNYLYF